MHAPFTNVGELQAVAEMYQNPSFIADLVLPRVRSLTSTYRYLKYPPESRYTVPNTDAGRYSPPNRVEERWIEGTGTVQDYGLDHPIPMQDFRDASANGVDIRLSATSYLTQLVKLDREIRCATLIFDSTNYAAGLTITLGAGTQWSDDTSDPVGQVLEGIRSPLLRPNIMVFGSDSWKEFRSHPKIVEAVRGAVRPGNNAASQGFVNEEDVAALFGLEAVYVGDAQYNTAALGQTPSYSRVFNDSAALLHRNTMVSSTFDRIVTWGYTVEFGRIVAGEIVDPDMGLNGGIRVRVGETLQEQVVAPSAGYLFLDTVA